MRAGSFLLWNQLLVHGSCANNSANFRIAQFITGFRAGFAAALKTEVVVMVQFGLDRA